MDIIYQGEHVWPGIIGNFFIVLSFVGALFATFSYAKATKDSSWKALGRLGFRIHSISVAMIVVMLFYMLFNYMYEYAYVRQHLNNEMPWRYLLSSFWNGQEGGFMLWTMWQVVLGNILIRKAKDWEPWVMAVFSSIQGFLACMLLGVFVGDYQIGLNPFLLVRELPENMGLPWTQSATYLDLDFFKDGNGLNPLLQNYWMTIHPPTVFLGFASTSVPFCYAIGGFWRKDFKGWMTPAIPWAFFGVMILGTGILMGGAWAYEALSFGGFWAWDPVENMSLVPWLTLAASAHLMVVNKRKTSSLFTTYLLTGITFLLVVYATFLVRSGMLGETSVHSFVDGGIMPQLLAFMLFYIGVFVYFLVQKAKIRKSFAWISFGMFFLSVVGYILADLSVVHAVLIFLVGALVLCIGAYRDFKKYSIEENLWTREFWMFVGALVLVASCIQITAVTSLPVLNSLSAPYAGFFDSLFQSTDWEVFKKLSLGKIGPPTDVIDHYNKWQVPFAIIVALLIATTQYFKYKNTKFQDFVKRISRGFIIAAVITLGIILLTDFHRSEFSILAMLFTTVFAIVSNFDYIVKFTKGRMDFMGPSISHIGFAMILLGALVSTSQKHIISTNAKLMVDVASVDTNLKFNEDIYIPKGVDLPMGKYYVRYEGRESEGVFMRYKVRYFETVPNDYKKGDVVFFNRTVFEAQSDFTSDWVFINDFKRGHWKDILPNDVTAEHSARAKQWEYGAKGKELFTLTPQVQKAKNFEATSEPSTKHYFGKDLYTFVKYAQTEAPVVDDFGYLPAEQASVQIGDTIITSSTTIFVDSISPVPDPTSLGFLPDDIMVKLSLSARRTNGTKEVAQPLFVVRGKQIVPHEALMPTFGLKFTFDNVQAKERKFDISYSISEEKEPDYIIMQAIVFPQINILWIGCLVMIIGTCMAIRHRLRLNKKRTER